MYSIGLGWWKSSLWLVGIVLMLLSCQSNSEYAQLHSKIEILATQELDDALIFMTSDYDCETCVASLLRWENEIQQAQYSGKVLGFYYAAFSKFQYQNYVNATSKNIQWSALRKENTAILEEIASLEADLKLCY